MLSGLFFPEAAPVVKQGMRAIWTLWGAAGLASLVACGQPKTASDSHGDDQPPPPSSGADGGSHVDDDQPSMPAGPATTTTTKHGPAAAGTTSAPSSPVPTSTTVYDKEAVEVGLKRAARQTKANCGAATDDEGKATGPWGKTTVTVKLGHNGHSQGATVTGGFAGKPVGKCIDCAFSGFLYPPFAGPDTTVDYEVEVVQPP